MRRSPGAAGLAAAFCLAMFCALLPGLVAPASGQDEDQQDQGAAEGDTLQISPEDQEKAMLDAMLQAEQELVAQHPAGHLPLILSWRREPKVGLNAQVRKVGYFGDFNSAMTMQKQVVFTQKISYSLDDYRKQDKTVQKRDGTLLFKAGKSLPVDSELRMGWNWSEDKTVNSAGRQNVNLRDFKQAGVTLTKMDVPTGFLTHNLVVGGSVNDQKGVNQSQRNDYSEGTLNGAVRSRFSPVQDVMVTTSVFGQHVAGKRSLADFTSPSSANSDSLGSGLFFDRGFWRGSFSVRKSNLDKRYLDYNRNANGLIDTTNVAQKIVEELEQQDGISLVWNNSARLGPVGLVANLTRDLDKQSYRASHAGHKESHTDVVDLKMSFRYSRKDSIRVGYKYQWRWDDQTYKGALESRGRQISKIRNLDFSTDRRIFPNSLLGAHYVIGLTQDIAKRQFNDNDRDRLESDLSFNLTTDWKARFRTTMIFDYRHIEDISIRQNRSANNNNKDTYELTPGYSWPMTSWLSLQQDFRLSIQYTDYVFDYLPTVSRSDDYNKRGTVTTRVQLLPSSRLSFTISHDYNARFNASKAGTDASGHSYYSNDLKQRISTINFGFSYKANSWLRLDGATFRTKDLKDQYGVSVTSTDTRSGELWLGGSVNKNWGKNNSRTLAMTVKNYHAYGPNVQETNARYWDADASFSWKF